MQNRKNSYWNWLFCSFRDLGVVVVSLNLIPVGSRAARVNSSDIRNKFWCKITVLDRFSRRLVTLLILFKTMHTFNPTQATQNANASSFDLRTNFDLSSKRNNTILLENTLPLNGLRTLYSFSWYKLLLLQVQFCLK